MKSRNKETYSYYKTAYRANKRYREKIGSDEYGEMLSKAEYNEMKASGYSTKQIVYDQFHFYSKQTALDIQKSLQQEGFKVSLKDIQARNYSKEIYDAIDLTYHALRDGGMSSKEAAVLISYTYYGS